MHVVPSSPEDKAMLDAHLLWERMVIEKLEVQPDSPHELGLAPFAAGWAAGRKYVDPYGGFSTELKPSSDPVPEWPPLPEQTEIIIHKIDSE
jgi:hypothetical protein